MKIDDFKPGISYQVYKKYNQGLFSKWKKDNSLSGNSLDYIIRHFRGMEDKDFVEARKELIEAKSEKGVLFYTFKHHPPEYYEKALKDVFSKEVYYKIIPKLRIKG